LRYRNAMFGRRGCCGTASRGPARTPWGTLGARPPDRATRGPTPRTH
jgi:hypothetical protein